jgi:hypothetical protein
MNHEFRVFKLDSNLTKDDEVPSNGNFNDVASLSNVPKSQLN